MLSASLSLTAITSSLLCRKNTAALQLNISPQTPFVRVLFCFQNSRVELHNLHHNWAVVALLLQKRHWKLQLVCTLHSISACLRLISCSCTCRSLFWVVSVCTRSWRQRLSCSARRSWLLWIWFWSSKQKNMHQKNNFTAHCFSSKSQ